MARLPDEIVRPTVEGMGASTPQPAPPLPPGYTEEELFVAGAATSFDPVTTPDDGSWTVTRGRTAPYRTRVVVRRPPTDRFSGTVLVEWFNVSVVESSPDWAYLADEIGREGHAYVGVSAQAQGVEGGQTLLDVDVGSDAGSSFQSANAAKSGLKHVDPERYRSLDHPGGAYSYDIFSQVGRAAVHARDELLGGLDTQRVIAVGESQSAAFLTTLVNAVHPVDPAFDGFLIHSRGAGAAPLDGNFDANRRQITAGGVRVRTDLDVPVLMFETETDLTLLGYSRVRQPDTDLVRTWEVAGTSHADAYLIQVVTGGPRDPNVGSLLSCEDPINVGLQHEVLQAALHHVVRWVAGGAPPPPGVGLELVDDAADQASIARDANANALGGVRNPFVDVPVATLTGEPSPGTTTADLVNGGGTCILFGRTIPFESNKLTELYGNADAYVTAFRASADDAVAAGFLLRPDADALVAEAEANRHLFS